MGVLRASATLLLAAILLSVQCRPAAACADHGHSHGGGGRVGRRLAAAARFQAAAAPPAAAPAGSKLLAAQPAAAPGKGPEADPGPPDGRTCLTPWGDDLIAAMPEVEKKVYGKRVKSMDTVQLAAAIDASPFPSTGLRINIHYHVIALDSVISAGDTSFNVTTAAIRAQLAVLNSDYAGSGLSWRTASTTWYSNASWAGDCFGSAGEIMQAVVKVPAKALNVVLCDLGFLGVAFGQPFPGYDQYSTSQAVFIDFRTLPGGPSAFYSAGRTLTHEAGHWAGLNHVFSGSCDDGGDGIDDTPQQVVATYGCPVNQDSCPTGAYPGKDAVNNFMDYSYDSCMTGFSLGQVARMQAVVLEYRPVLLGAATIVLPAPPPPRPRPPPPRRPSPPPPRRLPPATTARLF